MHVALHFLWHLSLCLYACAQSDSSIDFAGIDAPPAFDQASDDGFFGYYPTREYITEVDLNTPRTNFVQWSPECNDGAYYFITPRGWGIGNPGPMLLDQRGDLVWAHHFENDFGGQAYDFTVQKYQGNDYLTFWLGDDRVRGHGSGFYYMLNASYDIVHRVGAANGLSADLHEFLITPEGTALMTMYEVVEYDLSSFPDYHPDEESLGPSYIWDCLFQEISIETGDLLYEWRASDHVNISATYRGIGPGGSKDDPFDWFHINSIAKDELGNYLISSRYFHSVLYVEGRTGNIIWSLGGKENDFMDLSGGNATNFAWQHDARFLSTDTFPSLYSPPEEKHGMTTRLVTLFDNAAEDQHYEYGLEISRGLLLEITYPNEKSQRPETRPKNEPRDADLNTLKVQEINGTSTSYTVRVIQSYENPQSVRSSSQGSVQILPPSSPGQDPRILVGYGLNAVWSEFSANGTVLCDVHYGATTSWERGDIQSYRTYKFPWIGRPNEPPKVEISDDDFEVYVSWNGATQVRTWVLQCSDEASSNERAWEDVVSVKKTDFEETIAIPEDIVDSRYLRVIALDAHDRRLEFGTSRILDRITTVVGAQRWMDELAHAITVPKLANGVPPLRSLLSMVFMALTVLGVLHAYRRFLSRRVGTNRAGPMRWKQGSRYRLLSDA
ncbi:unnamed protein product [Zymoseptoria tritici ST99CH_1A5]|uniref:ASST-domain-containing protein n=2 Tax=Zymoseptoria tritici TaxID=1047171 RepID=A0A1X7RDZ0_ZYMT9|nr:unnamed protein product [Zymoseptoria tritici ST99CH_3D7]SMR44178.1 unnamed protein product [Zymoseptoria tritici ST99CH_3D1]SMY19330.1 unnamed protein product [Zymoseptoria tritici ST99CH_1A5]